MPRLGQRSEHGPADHRPLRRIYPRTARAARVHQAPHRARRQRGRGDGGAAAAGEQLCVRRHGAAGRCAHRGEPHHLPGRFRPHPRLSRQAEGDGEAARRRGHPRESRAHAAYRRRGAPSRGRGLRRACARHALPFWRRACRRGCRAADVHQGQSRHRCCGSGRWGVLPQGARGCDGQDRLRRLLLGRGHSQRSGGERARSRRRGGVLRHPACRRRRAEDRGETVAALRRPRRSRQRRHPRLRSGAQVRGCELHQVYVRRHPARLSQRHGRCPLQQGSRRARLAAHDRVFLRAGPPRSTKESEKRIPRTRGCAASRRR